MGVLEDSLFVIAPYELSHDYRMFPRGTLGSVALVHCITFAIHQEHVKSAFY